MKPLRIAALVAVGAAVVAFAGVGRPDLAGGTSEPSGGITVSGTGTVQTTPDQAQFSLGVEADGPTARAALAANSERMRRVLAALFAAGVARKEVQTQDVSISRAYPDESRYSAHNSVSVTIRELAKAGSILDAATNAGANDVYGPTLSRSDQDEQRAKALQEAVANARAKAKALADAAGVRLGSVTAITENDAEPTPYYDAVRLAKSSISAPIEPGRQQVQATVRVTFAIG
ncbi:MAG TPA: SIMPL domain-containing protein [Gaiellaceae bacterium]|nr:SIMPL domain-containing protein [Gaiellaceae bacterium]